MKNNIKYILYVTILISIIVYYRWVFGWTFGAGDWWYYFPETIRNWPSKFLWITGGGFGAVNQTLWRLPSESLYWLSDISQIGDKLWVFFPYILLTPIAVFIFLKTYFTRPSSILVGSLFFLSNSYFLAINSQGHIPLSIASSILLITFIFYKKFIDSNGIYYGLIMAITLLIVGFYDFRFVYIGLIILFSFTLFNLKKLSSLKITQIFSLGFGIFLLNLFWLLPIINTGFGDGVGRDLFGKQFWTLSHAITLHHPFWTLTDHITWFTIQSIPFFYWIFPIVAIFGYIRNRKKPDALFFIFLLLLGIFLSKMNNEPFGFIYDFLYGHLPGFNAFRESTKFYSITLIAYVFLIALFIENSTKKIRILSGVIFGVICLITCWPIISGQAGEMYTQKNIPIEYINFGEKMEGINESFRTMWVPSTTRYSYYDNLHPRVSNTSIIGSDWSYYNHEVESQDLLGIENKIVDIYFQDFSKRLFDISSIKYVIIPLQIEGDDLFTYYGGESNKDIRNWYINKLDTVKWLHRVDLGNSNLVIYENKDYNERIYLTKNKETIYKKIPHSQVQWNQVNPTKYSIYLKNVSGISYLNFSESFHTGWSLKIGDFSWFDSLVNNEYYLLGKYHFQNDAKLNSFIIDADYIKDKYPGSYIQNSDGTIDIDINIYFHPQSYFYFGLIISISALLACILYIIFLFKKKH